MHCKTTRYIDQEQIAKLRRISEQLHGGSDKERDTGHKLWLILEEISQQHIDSGDAS